MRNTWIFSALLLSFGVSATAHQTSGFNWMLPEFDGKIFVACMENPDASECQAYLYPCETAFDLSVGAELAAMSSEIRHDLTACFMAQYHNYEDTLWRLAPGSDPDPALSRETNMMYRHHANAPGDCRSTQSEKTEDWRCAAQEISQRLFDVARTTQ